MRSRSVCFQRGLTQISAAEFSNHLKQQGSGKAQVFFSHAQGEPLLRTFRAMRRVEIESKSTPKFWLDIFCLRQCISDFVLEKVKETIKLIEKTVMLIDSWQTPSTLTRTFCVFEIISTLESGAAFSTTMTKTGGRKFGDEICKMIPPDCQGKMISIQEAVERDNGPLCMVYVEKASCRDPEAKKQMDDDIIKQFGSFEAVNSKTRDAIIEGINTNCGGVLRCGLY